MAHREVSTFFIAMADADITWDLGGGQIDGSTELVVLHCKEGDVITVIKAPVREGYRFLYWKGSSYQPGQSYNVTGDHIFVAQWEKITEEETGNNTSSQDVENLENHEVPENLEAPENPENPGNSEASEEPEAPVSGGEQAEERSGETPADEGVLNSPADSEESTGDDGKVNRSADTEDKDSSDASHSEDADNAKAKSPATGDEAHIAMYTLTAAAAMIGISILRMLQKRMKVNKKSDPGLCQLSAVIGSSYCSDGQSPSRCWRTGLTDVLTDCILRRNWTLMVFTWRVAE